MRKAVSFLIAIIVLILGCNFFYVSWPAHSRLTTDPRNGRMTFASYLEWGIDPSTLVVDLWRVDSGASMIDIDRGLLDIAAALKDRDFESVILSFKGKRKFRLTGSFFKQIGNERDWQNPVYTIRTLPENLQTVDRKPAFPKWTGGMIGVLNRQMEDHQSFHFAWYISSLNNKEGD